MAGKIEQAVETFAQAMACGSSQREAYRRSHPRNHSQDRIIDQKASAFAKRADVRARIAELKGENAANAQMTREELVGMLTAEIRESWRGSRTTLPVVKLMDILTRVCGYDRQTVDVKAEVCAVDPEAVAEKLNFLAGRQGEGRRA